MEQFEQVEILLVEDNGDLREMTAMLLGELGFVVEQAATPAEASSGQGSPPLLSTAALREKHGIHTSTDDLAQTNSRLA